MVGKVSKRDASETGKRCKWNNKNTKHRSELGTPQSQRMTLEGRDDLPGPHLWHPRWFTGHWRPRCLLQLKANDSKWSRNATKLQCTTAGSGETKALVFCRSDLVGTKHAQRLQKQAMADSAQQWICHDIDMSFKIAKANRDQTNDVKPSNYSKENQEFTWIPLPGTSSSGMEFTDKLQEATLRWVPHWTTGICVVPRKRDEGNQGAPWLLRRCIDTSKVPKHSKDWVKSSL